MIKISKDKNETKVVVEKNNKTLEVLFSYNTPIACQITDSANGSNYSICTNQKYSHTTLSHLIKWKQQNPCYLEAKQEDLEETIDSFLV